jgi:uncharacterized protein (TIGR02444 family)
MSERASRLDTPLWDFVMRFYMRDGVSPECIELQDRYGVNVNLLLLAAYCGAEARRALSPEDVKAAAQTLTTWHDDVTEPLRHARRALKPWGANGQNPLKDEAEALRNTVKAAELDSEKFEIAMLWDWLGKQGKNAGGDPVRDSIRSVLVHYGLKGDEADPLKTAPRLCAAASGKD